ncbi:MAG: hypothetical protein PF487_12160, partial [Bacteroidales bacterium]|nr:hypothetical protein [Bacteroidales bacterium]
NDSDPNFIKKQEEINQKWVTWKKEVQKKRDESNEINLKKITEQNRKRREAQKRWEKRMKPIKEGFAEIGAWFHKTFTVERGRVNMIVKRTKQFVGLLITLFTLAFTFVAVNYISLGLMVAADWCIAHWKIFLGILILGITGGIIYLIYVLISSLGQAIVNKYKTGKKVWYIEPIIYVIWYPTKYIVMGISFLVVNILWIPIKFIFYTFLFKWLLKPIGIFIGKLTVSIVKGIASSTGIFGEYFGASYSDYCPGIEWTDFDEE